MPFSAPIQTNFSTGEISPLMQSRVDIQQYYNAAKKIENMYVFPEGGVTKRPGLQYLGTTKYNNKSSILIPFRFSTDQAYILEFGHEYFRIWANGGIVTTGSNVLTNPTFSSSGTGWTTSTNGTGTVTYGIYGPTLSASASAGSLAGAEVYQDVSVSPGDSFTIETFIQSVSLDQGTGSGLHYARASISAGWYDASDVFISNSSVYSGTQGTGSFQGTVTAPTGAAKMRVSASVTSVTSDGSPSSANMTVGTIYAISQTGSTIVEVSTNYQESEVIDIQFCQSADELYLVHPNHPPRQIIRSSHVSWSISDITFTGAPSEWTSGNYPSAISFFEQRLCFASTPNQRRRIYCSESGNYFEFTIPSSPTDTSPIIADLTDNEVNAISWMYPRNSLFIGSSSGIGTFGSNTNYDPLTPTNSKFNPESSDRTGSIVAKRMGNIIICTDLYQKTIRAIEYDENRDIVTSNMLQFADHLTSDAIIIDYAFQQYPVNILWCVLDNGKMISVTFKPESGVLAWSRHSTIGFIESISSIPSQGTSNSDEIYVVSRSLTGLRSIQRIAPQFSMNGDIDYNSLVFLDSSISTSFSSPVTTISGLDHLIALPVYAFTDGIVQGPYIVNSSGEITLDIPASTVTVGLEYTSEIECINFNGGGALGTAEGRLKRISEVTVNLYKSSEFTMGRSDKQYTQTIDNQFTGPYRNDDFPGDFSMETDLVIKSSKPLPLTVLSIIPTMLTQERT